jgi:autotransporter-associated beta strand protein
MTAALLAFSSPLAAQTTYTWDAGGANTSWGTAANWVGDAVPTFDTNAILVFNTNVGSADMLFLGANRQFRSIIFGSSLTGGGDNVFDIRNSTALGSGTANMHFNGGAGNASITVENSALVRIRIGQNNTGVTAFQTDTDLDHNSAGTVFQFDGAVTGAGALNKRGVGTVTFTRANSYNGLNLYGGGAAVWNNAAALGTNSVTLGETGSSSNVSLFFGSGLNYTNAITVSSGSGTRLIGNTDVTNQFTGLGLGAITGNAILSGGIDLAAGKDVTFAITNYVASTTDRMSVNAAVTGTGGIVKTGNGILLLTASNSYSGATDIQGGKLYLGGAGRLGSGAVTISNGANLDFGTGSGQTNIVANNVSGDGAIIQSTAGTETRITGDITSTGGMEIQSGTLRIGNGGSTGSYSGSATVASGAVLALARDNAYTHGGTISGAGGVTKVNAGDVILTASNSYSGVTALFAGALVAGDANALGTGDITFNPAGGNTGTIRYTAASAGTDWASRIVNSSGTIRLDTDGNNVNLAGAIASNNIGGLVKSGNGTLTLGGANAYTGATTIGGGTLLVATNGSIASSSLATVNSGGLLQVNGTAGAITVNNGGSLGGSGSVGAVTLTSGSLLKPGNSPGLLTASAATWAAGSTYQWEIDNATGTAGRNWDVFSVTGALDLSALSSGQMNLVLQSLSIENYNTSTSYTWVIAKAGSFTGVGAGVTDLTSLFNINSAAFNGGAEANLPNGGFKVVTGTEGSLRTLELMAIPEPSTGSMLALGLAGLVVTRLLRRKSS